MLAKVKVANEDKLEYHQYIADECREVDYAYAKSTSDCSSTPSGPLHGTEMISKCHSEVITRMTRNKADVLKEKTRFIPDI
jgi:hypothetical protein